MPAQKPTANMPLLSKDGSIHVTDESINTITSMVGACFGLMGAGLLVIRALQYGNIWTLVGVSVYGASLISLFVFSALHHGIEGTPKVNQLLRTFDYLSIFFLIGGTVTPLVLILYRNLFGWTVLGAVWVIIAIGASLRACIPHLPKYITNTLFIVLGWMPIVLIGDGAKLPDAALALLVIGGLIYSIGFVLYITERPNIKPGIFGFHELWHCLVLIAAACHYFLLYFFVVGKF